MKALITGSHGFIGKNLCAFLKNRNYTVLEFNSTNSFSDFEVKIKEAEILYHLAGKNRVTDDYSFTLNNIEFTENICKTLIKNKIKIPIVYSSSIQIDQDNAYGKSKIKAENILKNLNEINNNPIIIYRLPGVFGKWCKPNYNSIIATLCHNILNNINTIIDDENKELKLVYIDDVVKTLTSLINEKRENKVYYESVKNQIQIKIKEIIQLLDKYNYSKSKIEDLNFSNKFKKDLYSTFISYYQKKDFVQKQHFSVDKRGKFVEFLRSNECGQISYFTINPKLSRGDHYHHSKTEKFIILNGKVKFEFNNIVTKENFNVVIDSKNNEIIHSIPGWNHKLTNITDETINVLLWSNEVFDNNNPDTFILDNEKF